MYWTAELSRSRRSAPVSGSDVSDRRFGVRQAFKNRHATGPGAESRRLTRRHPRARHALLHAVLHACAKAPADLFSLHLTPSATRWCMGVCRRQRRHRPRARPQRGMSDCRRCASGAAPATMRAMRPRSTMRAVQDVTAKLLSVFKQFATLWKRVSQQLEGSSSQARLPERRELPHLANEMVRLALQWVRPPPPSLHTLISSASVELSIVADRPGIRVSHSCTRA